MPKKKPAPKTNLTLIKAAIDDLVEAEVEIALSQGHEKPPLHLRKALKKAKTHVDNLLEIFCPHDQDVSAYFTGKFVGPSAFSLDNHVGGCKHARETGIRGDTYCGICHPQGSFPFEGTR